MQALNNYRFISPYKGLSPYLEKDRLFFFGRGTECQIIINNLKTWQLTVLYGSSGVGKSSILRAGVVHQLNYEAQKNMEKDGYPGHVGIVFPPFLEHMSQEQRYSWENPVGGIKAQIRLAFKELGSDLLCQDDPSLSLTKTLKNWIDFLSPKKEESEFKFYIVLDQFEEYLGYLRSLKTNRALLDKFAIEFVEAINDSDLNVNFLISIRRDSLAELDYFKSGIRDLLLKHRLELKPLDRESAFKAIQEPIHEYNHKAIILDSLLNFDCSTSSSPITILCGNPETHKSTLLRDGICRHLNQVAKRKFGESGKPELAAVIFNSWHDNTLEKLIKKIKMELEGFGFDQSLQVQESFTKTLQEWARFISNQPEGGKLFLILDQFEEYFWNQQERNDIFGEVFAEIGDINPKLLILLLNLHFLDLCSVMLNFWFYCQDKPIQELLGAIKENQLKNIRLLIAIRENWYPEIKTSFQDYISSCTTYLQLSKDGGIKKAPINSENSTIYELKEESDIISIDPDLAEKVWSGLTQQGKKPIVASWLQLVMDRLWKEEVIRNQVPTIRAQTFLDLGKEYKASEAEKGLSDEERSVRKIIEDYILERLGSPQKKSITKTILPLSKLEEKEKFISGEDIRPLSDEEQDIAASIFHYLITPGGYKLPQFVSDLVVSANEYRKLYELEPPINKDQTQALANKLSEQDYRILYLVEQDRYEVFHDFLCAPISRWAKKYIDEKIRFVKSRGISEKVLEGYVPIKGSATPEPYVNLATVLVNKLILESWKAENDAIRQDEKIALLACQAYQFREKYQTRLSNEVDEALRRAATRRYFSPILHGHERQVSCVAFHPDSRRFVSGFFAGTIRLWDINLKTSQSIVLSKKPHEFDRDRGGVLSVTISPDGHKVAAGGGNHKVWILDLEQPSPESLTLPDFHDDEVWSVAFSPDGKFLASGSWDTKVCLWDLTDSKKPAMICYHYHPDQVWSLAFSGGEHSGYTLAVGCLNGTVWLWKVKPDQPIKQRLWKICLVSGDWVVKSDRESRGKWGQKLDDSRSQDEKKNRIFSIALSPDGRSLFAGSQGGKIWHWDLSEFNDPASKFVIPTLLSEQEYATRSVVAISNDTQWLASGDDRGIVTLWRRTILPNKAESVFVKETELKGHKEGISSVCFSKNNQWLVSGSWDGTIRLWDLEPSSAEPVVLQEHSQQVVTVAFSPDNKKLASGSHDHTVRLWKWDVSPIGRTHYLLKDNTTSNFNSVAFNRDGTVLAAGTHTGEIRVWKPDKLEEKAFLLKKHEGEITAITFHPKDSNKLASGSCDCTIRLWDLSKPDNPKCKVLGKHTDTVTAVAFSPDGEVLASGSSDCTVRLWLVNQLDIPSIPWPNRFDGKVSSIAFIPNHPRTPQLLAIATDKRTVEFWDVSPFPKANPCFCSEYSSIRGKYIAFSPTGLLLASDAPDGKVLIWDLDHPKDDPVELEGHSKPVKALTFSCDGQWLVTGSEDNTIRLWMASTQVIANICCQKVWRNLSCQEWNDFVGGDIPYEPACKSLPPGEDVSAGERLEILKGEFKNKLDRLFPEQRKLLERLEEVMSANRVVALSKEEVKDLYPGSEPVELLELKSLTRLDFLTQFHEEEKSGRIIEKYRFSDRYLTYLSSSNSRAD